MSARAGIQAGDQILKVDDVDLTKQPSTVLTTYVQSKNPGTTVKLVILRGEQNQTIPVELGKMPDEMLGQVDPRVRNGDAFFNDWLHDALAKPR